jgi:chorismate--pyruvate lyase|tara:strand:- start:622 stop:1209 length:588 start_codon:yes stop_codon:yes gene_type:complete
MSQKHPLFPIQLTCHWQDPVAHNIPEYLLNWLVEPSSLTARLKRHGGEFRVEVLGQQIDLCQSHEANDMIKAGEQVLVREVLLYCDDVPQVFARSLLPLSTLTDDEQVLAELGNQPLGQVLFNNPSLERKNLTIAAFDQSSSVGLLVKNLSIDVDAEFIMWGRSSLFFVHQKPLMVAEVFLPQAFAYQKDVDKNV